MTNHQSNSVSAMAKNEERKLARMDDEEYIMIQQQLILFAGLVRPLRLDLFVERISMSENLSPILDPTLYRTGCDKLQQIKRLACSLRAFQDEIQKQLEDIGGKG